MAWLDKSCILIETFSAAKGHVVFPMKQEVRGWAHEVSFTFKKLSLL